jgi:hypothetical protein
VVGEDPSAILGRLTANGQVFLVNPNGIYFGKDSQIDVAGLVASTHNIRNDDFLAGHYNFNIPGKPGASVINEGAIRIADTGIAAFVAPSVENRGVIVAKLGKVVLAAANGFTLDFTGDHLINFLVGDEVAKTAFDIDGKQLTSFVENAGRIEAQGGYVLLTAKAAEKAIHSVINQSGTIEATTVGTHKGEIILQAGKGSLSVSGTLDASAPNGGDGGSIETSGGHVIIDPITRITTAALSGKTGHWLIDPTDYTIAASGGEITGAGLAGYLAATHVEVQTAASGSGNGDIFVNDSVTWSTFNKLTLTAFRNIYVNQAINATGGGSVKLRSDADGTGTGTVAFAGNGHITVNNGGAAGIYYSPVSYTDATTKSDANGNPYTGAVTDKTGGKFTAYMRVNNVNQLQAMNTNLSGVYALGKDIDASVTSGWNSGAGFAPVGSSYVTPFKGTFNGQGFTISGLTINRPTESGVGLFGVTGYFSTRTMISNSNVGIVEPFGGTIISNIGMMGGAITGLNQTGGLVGWNRGYISQAYATGSVMGNNAIGGLVGQNDGVIYRSYATGTVKGVKDSGGYGSNYIGGLVGIVDVDGGLINQSYATGSVSGSSYIGGLVGVFSQSNAYGGLSGIRQSYATGTVLGNDFVGGLVGDNGARIFESYATGHVTPPVQPPCPISWSCSGNAGRYGGLVGVNSGVIVNSFWDIDTTGQTTSAGGTGLTTAQMKQQASFSGWDFANTWQITEGVSRPTLKVASAQPVTVLKPGVNVTPPPVTLTPNQQLLVQEHQNDNPSMLLIAIGNGLFSNSPSDPVWTGMFQNGAPTQAQVTANSLWPTYALYKSATASKVLEGLTNGNIVYGGAIWTALGSSNQQNRNDAYYSFTHPTPPVSPIDSFLGLDANELYAAVINNKLEESYSTSANWLALKANNGGNATAAQITANIMLNAYNRYKSYSGQALADKLYQDVVVKPFSFGGISITNDSSNPLWKGFYGGTLQAGSAQSTANIMLQSFNYYNTTDKRSGYALFTDLLRGTVTLPGVGQQTITNAPSNLVWRGIYGWSGGLHATNAQQIADDMKGARDTY